MNITEYYYRVVDLPTWVGLTWACYVAAGLVVIATILLLAGKLRWFARSLGLVALVVIVGVLYDIQGQSIRLMSFGGHYRHLPRHSPAIRIWARAGMVAIPAVAIAIMTSAWGATRQTQRSQVPHQLKAGRQHFLRKEYDAALCDTIARSRRLPNWPKPTGAEVVSTRRRATSPWRLLTSQRPSSATVASAGPTLNEPRCALTLAILTGHSPTSASLRSCRPTIRACI